jgi:hypothetical protein
VFFVLISAPPSTFVTYQYIEFGLETILFLFILFTFLLQLKGPVGEALVLTAVFALFFIALIHKWQTADNYFLLGGFFPQSDAISYYVDAQRLIHGFRMNGAGSTRPIYPVFLAGLLLITNNNLQWTLIILSALNAFAVFLAAFEIRKTLQSSLAAAVYLTLAYMFFRRFSGTVMTENLGFCLGNLALIFLIRGAFQNHLQKILFGIFLLTLGLNARAGAFLVLPVLVIWVGLFFRQPSRKLISFLLPIAAILSGFIINSVVARLSNSPDAQVFSNYSYTLYGLASGNKGWEQASIDHPTASASEIYSFTFQKIADQPSLFINGILGAYRDFFKSDNGAFSFLLLKQDRGDLANIVLWPLTILGIIHAFVQTDKKHLGISVVFFLGVFISISLLPPADSVRMRTQATTIPLSLYVICAGLTLPQTYLNRTRPENALTPSPQLDNPLDLALPFGLVFLAVCTLPAFLPLTGKVPVPDSEATCTENRQNHYLEISNGNAVQLTATSTESIIPFVSIERFAKKIARPEQQVEEQSKSFFFSMPSGSTMTLAQSLPIPGSDSTNNSIILVTDGFLQPGTYNVCLIPASVGGFFTLAEGSSIPSIAFPHPALHKWAAYLQITAAALICLIALANFSGLTSLAFWRQPLQLAVMILLSFSFIFILHQTGIIALSWDRQVLSNDRIRNPGNAFLYSANIGTNKVSDTKLFNFNVKLYEDSILIGPQHETQSLIDTYGGGGYILKDDFLFFSASDNTDPRLNGREYSITYPTRVRLRHQMPAYAALLLGLALWLKNEKKLTAKQLKNG